MNFLKRVTHFNIHSETKIIWKITTLTHAPNLITISCGQTAEPTLKMVHRITVIYTYLIGERAEQANTV